MNKKDKVKQFASRKKTTWTVKGLHFAITGAKDGIRWDEPFFNVSKSTVRRALDEMLRDGEVFGFFPVGHCYDEYCYRIKLKIE